MTGDDTQAHSLALEARNLAPNHALIHRQARAWSLRDGDWEAVTRRSPARIEQRQHPEARLHGAIFAAEIARLTTEDRDA